MKLLLAFICALFFISCNDDKSMEKVRYDVVNEKYQKKIGKKISEIKKEAYLHILRQNKNISIVDFLYTNAEDNSPDSVFYFTKFNSLQKAEYAEYEKRRSIARMYEGSIPYWLLDSDKKNANYADSLIIYTAKMDSMATLSSKEPLFMGYVVSDKSLIIYDDSPEDTIRTIVTYYLPPTMSFLTLDRKSLISRAIPKNFEIKPE